MSYEQQNTGVYAKTFGATFLSKVFFFFGLAIAASAAGAYLGLNYLASALLASPLLFYGLMIGELLLILTSGLWSRRAPLSYLLFTVFAVLSGLTLVPVLAYLTVSPAGVAILVKAFTATALMFAACAVFGYTTHFNLQGLRGFLTMALLGLIVVGLVGLFIPWSSGFEMIYAGIGVIIFSGYTMYDVQRLKSYPEDAYIDAAIQLYLDIFNLFLFILRLLSSQRN